jgi:hypothetical protein
MSDDGPAHPSRRRTSLRVRSTVPGFALVLVVLAVPLVAYRVASQGSGSGAARAGATSDPFVLDFTLPRATWRSTDDITGSAALSVLDGQTHRVGGSGSGIIGFAFAQAGGPIVEPGHRLSCATYVVGPDHPLTTRIVRSGGFDATDPNASFLESFLTAPTTRLTPGDWDVTAIARFLDGCEGSVIVLDAAVRIHVDP